MESDEDAAEPLEPILPAAQCYQDLLRSLGGGHALKKLREVTMLAENADAETRIFERYDHDGSGDIDKEELRAALEEIGILDFDSASAEAPTPLVCVHVGIARWLRDASAKRR